MSKSSKAFDPTVDLPDLTGKVIIVTGATAGLGYQTSLQLARKGAKVYLAARNEKKALECIEKMKSSGLAPGNGELVFHKVDFSDPRAVKKSAEAFLAREDRLDVLVNNAGMLISDFQMSRFGIQEQMIVNHISPFVFTETLLPLLEKTADEENSDVRIVNVASSTHTYVSEADVKFQSKEDFNVTFDNKFFPSSKRYGFSKLANVLWTKELVNQLELKQKSKKSNNRIICLCLHPGPTFTEGNIRSANSVTWPISSLIILIMKLLTYTSEQGAYTISFAAASREVKDNPEVYNGAYLVPIAKIGEVTKTGQNVQLAKDLWKLTEEVVAEILRVPN